MSITPTTWGPTEVGAAAVAPSPWPPGGGGDTPPPSTVAITLPGSDEFPVDLLHVRRGMVGGTMSRTWFSFVQGGTTYAVSYTHNGSGADPTAHVAALSSATRIEVSLSSGAQTAAQVATATVSAINGSAASGASSDGATVTISGGSSLTIPARVDTTDRDRTGMFGAQRDHWGSAFSITQNGNGGTDGTGSTHLGQLSDDADIPTGRTGRILGVGIWGQGGYTPRLAAGTGPTYATDPGAITVIGQGQVSSGLTADADGNGELGIVLFAEPAEIDSDDELWAIYRGSTATAPGGPRFRAHGATPEGNGDIPASQVLTWDTAAPTAATTAIDASYDPTASSTFNIYIQIFVIFELQDGSGNYYADGFIDDWIGDQNPSPTHGTQFLADETFLAGEVTSHRFQMPQWYSAPVTQVRRAWEDVDLVGADAEDSRMCFYGPWASLAFPASPAPALIADAGLMGITAGNSFTTTTLGTPVQLGVDDIGANAVVSIGFNYVTLDGSTLGTMTLPVYIDIATGDGTWLDCWVDRRSEWHDDIPGASGRGYTSGVSEYRTRNVVGMPISQTTDTYPDPYVTDATDDSPNAIAVDSYRIQRTGMVAA